MIKHIRLITVCLVITLLLTSCNNFKFKNLTNEQEAQAQTCVELSSPDVEWSSPDVETPTASPEQTESTPDPLSNEETPPVLETNQPEETMLPSETEVPLPTPLPSDSVIDSTPSLEPTQTEMVEPTINESSEASTDVEEKPNENLPDDTEPQSCDDPVLMMHVPEYIIFEGASFTATTDNAIIEVTLIDVNRIYTFNDDKTSNVVVDLLFDWKAIRGDQVESGQSKAFYKEYSKNVSKYVDEITAREGSEYLDINGFSIRWSACNDNAICVFQEEGYKVDAGNAKKFMRSILRMGFRG